MNPNHEGRNNLPIHWVVTDLESCVDILDSKRKPINADERGIRLTGKDVIKYPYYGATGQVGWIDDFLFDEELLLLGEDAAPFFDKNKNVAYIIVGKTWVNNHAHVLKAIKEITSNKYLCHYLNIFDYHDYVTGTTRLKLPQTPLKKIPIKLPPLPEQHRIVAKLEELFTKLDVTVAELKKAKAQIKRYRQSVLKHAFEGKLTEQWRKQTSNVKGEKAEELLAKIKEERKKALGKKYKELPPVDTTNLPQLPDGWVWTSLEQITSVLGDGLHGTPNYSVDGKYYFINGNNLSDGKVEIKAETKRVSLEEYNKYEKPLCSRTILVSINGTLGNTAFYNKENIILGKSACYFNLYKQIDKHYIRYLLVSQQFIDYANKTATGSTIKNVPLSAMRAFEIPLASTIQEQQQVVCEIERHFSVADETEKIIDQSLKQAERLRQSILKDAFSGKLVPQDPNDETAEKLLERIKVEREKISKTKSNSQALPDGSPKENKKRRIK